MALRCIDALTGQSLHAFEFDPMEWDNLALRNKREGHLRAPCCQADVILRRSKLGTQHFVHRVRGTCDSAPETEEHRQVKRVIVEVGRANGWLADAEVGGLSPEGEVWRADVLLSKGAARIAIEVQWSKQSDDETVRRQARYASSGIRGLWVFRQQRFAASKDIPAVRICGTLADGFEVYVPTGTGEQVLPLAPFVSAVLNRQYRFGLPLGAPAVVAVRCGIIDCYRCGAETPIITGLDINVGPHKLSATIPELDSCPDLIALALQVMPQHISPGRIMRRHSQEANSRYLSNGCAHCGTLIGAHYEYLACENQAVVGKFQVVVNDRMRQLAIQLGEEPGWGVHPEISPI